MSPLLRKRPRRQPACLLVATALASSALTCGTSDSSTTPAEAPEHPDGGEAWTALDDEPGPVNEPRLLEPPCGDKLVAVLPTDAGTVVDICIGEDGDYGVAEHGPLDTVSGIPDATYECALDLYLALAPVGEVPQRLVDACPRPRSHSLRTVPERRIVLAKHPWELEGAFRNHFCINSSGDPSVTAQQEFVDLRCGQVEFRSDCTVTNWLCSGCYDNFHSCTSSLWNSMQRTASSQMGHNADGAINQLASCGGSTRFRAWRQNAGTGSFDGEADFDVGNGYWGNFEMTNGGTFDDDFRYRGDRYGSAGFRHSTGFCDEESP